MNLFQVSTRSSQEAGAWKQLTQKKILHSDLSGARPQQHSPPSGPFPQAPLLLHQSYKPFPCLLLKTKTQKNVNSATISTNLSEAWIGKLQYNTQFSPHLFFSFFFMSLSSGRLPSMLPTSELQTREPWGGQFWVDAWSSGLPNLIFSSLIYGA